MSRAALLASERWRRAFKLPGQPPSTPWARAPVADEPNPSAAKIAARGTSGLALGSDNKAISQRKYVEQIDKGVDAKAAERLAHKNAHDGHSAAHSDGSIYNSHHRVEGQLEGQVSTTDWKHREQIESWLHRSLTNEELLPASSLDALTDDQVAIVAAIQPHNRIAPMLFLKAVVPTAAHRDIIDFIDNIEDIAVVRLPPPELPDQRIFEHFAGRPLEPAERARVGTVYKMNPAQIELAETLARKDRAVAFLYLSRVAPDDPIEVSNELAKHLAGPA